MYYIKFLFRLSDIKFLIGIGIGMPTILTEYYFQIILIILEGFRRYFILQLNQFRL